MPVEVTLTLINAVTGAGMSGGIVSYANAASGRSTNWVNAAADVNGLATISLTTPTAAIIYHFRLPDGQFFGLPVLPSDTAIALGNISIYPQGVNPQLANISGLVQGAMALSAATKGGSAAMPGIYPNASYPSGAAKNLPSGWNDLGGAVPAGRKRLVWDYYVSNPTGGGIVHRPGIKISGTYYALGTTSNEPTLGVGHNYGMGATKFSNPIVLNAGESFAVNTDVLGLDVIVDMVEFDASSPLSRASISSWSNGDNVLLTVLVRLSSPACLPRRTRITIRPQLFNRSPITIYQAALR